MDTKDMKTKIVVSRKWHRPQIEAFADRHQIGVQMDLEDFIQAITKEIGNPTFLFTKAALANEIRAAAQIVFDEMKDHTKYVA